MEAASRTSFSRWLNITHWLSKRNGKKNRNTLWRPWNHSFGDFIAFVIDHWNDWKNLPGKPDFSIKDDAVQWDDSKIQWNSEKCTWFTQPAWKNLSPADYFNRFGCLNFLSGNKYFYENFGFEKLLLQQFLQQSLECNRFQHLIKKKCTRCMKGLDILTFDAWAAAFSSKNVAKCVGIA